MIRSRVLFILATLAVCAYVVQGTESSSSSSGSTTSSSSGASTPSSGPSGSTTTSGTVGSSSSTPLPEICETLDCRCLENATFSPLDVQLVTPMFYFNEPFTVKAVVDYRQCNINYNVFVGFRWKLFNDTDEVLLVGITTNKGTLTLPANYLTPGVFYTFRVTATGYRNETQKVDMNIMMAPPSPTVLLNGQSRSMRTGPSNIEIPVSITVAYGTVLTATWSCVTTGSGDACPASMDLSHATNDGVTIAGPVEAGNYTVTLTYDWIVRSLDLVVVATAVPKVTVDALTVPVAQPLKYAFNLHNLQLSFLAVMESNEEITGIIWTLNGETLTATERAIDLNESHIVAAGIYTLWVRATTASDYGEASVVFEISTRPTLTLEAFTNVDRNDEFAVSLKERISTTATPSVTIIFDVLLTYAVRYDDTRQGKPMSQGIASPIMMGHTSIDSPILIGHTITFLAPLPTTDVASKLVTFHVDLLLGKHVIATASGTFTVHTLSKNESAILQLAEMKTGGVDTAKTVTFLTNAGFLSDADVQASIAVQVVGLLVSAWTEALSEEDSDLVAATIVYLVTADTANEVMGLVFYLTLTAESAVFVADAVAAAIEVGASGSQVINATNKVAIALLSTGTIGEVKQLTSGGLVITTTVFILTDAEVIATGEGGSIELSPSLIAGLAAGKKFGVIVVKLPQNPFPAQAGITVKSDVVSFDVAANGAMVPVSGLATPITVFIRTTEPITDECRYYNTAAGRWDTTGLTKTGYSATHILCHTTHLSSFAAVEGTASGSTSGSTVTSSGSGASTPSSGSSGSTTTSGSDGSSSSPPLPEICETLDCRCLENATFASLNIQRMTPVFYVHNAIIVKAVVDYRQCNINYNVFVGFGWKLFNDTDEVLLVGITTNKGTLTLPANLMTPGVFYTFQLTATGYRNETQVFAMNIDVVVPPPTVLLNGQSRSMRTGPSNIAIPASITVSHGTVLTATWNCSITESGDACPQSMDLSHATNEGVTIAGPVEAGNYTVTLTYDGIVRSLDLVVVATAVPKVTVDALTVPVAQPLKYAFSLHNLQLSFLAVVESNEEITGIVWTLNGETLTSTERAIDLNESHVVAGPNTLSVRATTAYDYGEASVVFEISTRPTLTIGAFTNVDRNDDFAVSLKERISTTATPSVTTIFDVSLTYAVRYNDTRQGKPVSQGIASPVVIGNTITFLAPLPTTDDASVLVTFHVDVLLGKHVVATSSGTFTVHTIPKNESATLQLAEMKAGELDTAKTVTFLTNAGFLSDADVQASIAVQVVGLLVSAWTEALSEEDSDLVAATIVYLVTADTADTVMGLVFYLTLTAESAVFVADAVAAAIEVGAAGSQAINATNKVAIAFLSTATVGEPKQLTSGGLVITTTVFVLTVAEVSVAGEGGSISLSPSGIAGLVAGMKFGVIVIKQPKNPFPAQEGITMKSDVVSFDVAADGATVPVSGLATPITLHIRTTEPMTDECRYYNTATGRWVTVTKKGYTATHIICETTHLSSFAAVDSTASGSISVAVSAVVVLVAFIVQLAM